MSFRPGIRSLRAARRNRSQVNIPKNTVLGCEECEPRLLLTATSVPALGPADHGPVELAEETNQQFILSQVAADEATAYLQQADSDLQLIDVRTDGTRNTTLFQQTYAGLPIHGAYITAVQDGADSLATYDRGYKNLATSANTQASIAAQEAIEIATAELVDNGDLTNTSALTWYRTGNQARLTWQVDTFSGAADDTVDWVTFIDAHSGTVFEHQTAPRNEVDYLLEYPETITGVYPRIVINDAIGVSGSRAYAAPFDSVVSISVGCTGTLIAPDVVLSARHCGIGSGAQIVFGDNSNSSTHTATVASSFLPDGSGTLLDGGDVSILTLTQNVPANVATPMRLIDETTSLVGDVAATLGYGYNGVGSQGHGFSADGYRWGGENIIDVYGSPAATSGTNIFSTDFDNGTSGANTIGSSSATPLTYEATTAPGDSGGPLVVQVSNEWVIAGVLSGGTTNTSVYGDISWWTGVAPFKSDIEARGGQFVGSANGLGSVSLDADTYVAGDTVTVTVNDPNAVTPVNVTLTSDSGDSETITLASAGGSNYVSTITTSGANVSTNDGTLQVSAADQITVTYVDPDDGTGSSATVDDTATILVGDVAIGETNIDGSVTSGNYVDTHASDDVREVITEERYGGRRSRLQHRWDFDVSGGSSVTFNLEAYHDSSVEDFVFEYSANGGSSWSSLLTVTQSSDTSQSVNVGSLSGSVLVRVMDTDRSRRESSLDSIYVDEMYFSAAAPVPGVVITETGGSTSATEGGAGDTYSIVLETVPADNVTMTVSPDGELDLGNGSGAAVILTFTPQNALTPQVITVNAFDDSDDEGVHAGLITHSVSSNDGDYNGLSVQNVTVSIADNDSTGGGTDVASGETSIDGSITSGSYLDTHASDDVREVITEERYAGNKRTRMQHRWNFDVTGGSSVTFHLEAHHDSSVEDFVFEYSTNGGSSWNSMLTVTQSSDAAQSFNVDNVSGSVLVRVIDTDRSRNENVMDSIRIDEMYFESAAALLAPPQTPLAIAAIMSTTEPLMDKTESMIVDLTEPAATVRPGSGFVDSEQYRHQRIDTYFRAKAADSFTEAPFGEYLVELLMVAGQHG